MTLSGNTPPAVPCLINGKRLDHLTVLDRGLHYGDGVFETLAVVDRRPLCWDHHLARLRDGTRRLGIHFDEVAHLSAEVHALSAEVERAVLKVIITGGTGGRGYQRDLKATPTRLVSQWPWPLQAPPSGITARLCKMRLGHHPATAGIKHLNRLEQVLARNEWHDVDIHEGLLRDIDDNIIEGTMSNVFVVLPDKRLLTPDVSRCGVAGIVRGHILEHVSEIGLYCTVCPISLADVEAASELFFCNSIAGIMSVSRLGERTFSRHKVSDEIRDFLIAGKVIASP